MKTKSFIFLIVLIFVMVFSLSAVCADDLQTADSGQVSGDVVVVSENPYTTSGELTYDIPADAKDVKSADVYVNVYSGSAKNTYGANANVSLKTQNGENQIASEELWIENGTTDGTVYPVNDHVDKCYSDYQMRYDITDSLKGLNGTSISIKVDTFEMTNKSFDGRIKLIALVLAYDDGDADEINYWIDSAQRWTKTNVTISFDTAGVTDIAKADLTDIVLSSANGNFTLNDKLLGEPDNHTPGSTYQYSYWDVTDKIEEGKNTEIMSKYAGTSAYGSLKNALTVLKIQSKTASADVTFNTEYTSVPTCYAGTNNTLTVKVKANKAGKYMVELVSSDGAYETAEVELDGENETTLMLTDSKIRPIDETTINGANNTKVEYEVDVIYNGTVVGKANKTVPVLYNGNLGHDYEYDVSGLEQYYNTIKITGDVVVDVKDDSTYLGASDMNRTDVWNITLPEGSELKEAYIFVPYNWFNAKAYNETIEMFDAEFNGYEIVPLEWYRDQGNLGNYGQYGYGVMVYNLNVNQVNTTGTNTLVLNKKNPTPAVYPSTFVYMYDVPGGSLKEVELVLGADLLSNSNNNAGRVVKTDSLVNLSGTDFDNVTLYVLAAGAQKGEGNIVVNGKVFEDVWSGSSKTTDLFTTDITDVFNASNNISFVATGSTILALPQILVADTGIVVSIDSIKTEYSSVPTAYAGTSNLIKATITVTKDGNYTIMLFEGFDELDELEATLTNGTNTVELFDETVRPVDETTVNGADNKNVTYTVVVMKDKYMYIDSITVPLLYNGYLDKKFEYNATYIEDVEEYAVTGGVEVDVKDDSTYMSTSALNRTDVWNIDLGENESLANAFVYLSYNWDKTGTAGPALNVTFNGNAITPKSNYRDQGNLGRYGSYGYGLYIYDVSELAQAGNNTLFISKEKGMTALYPTSFIYLYNSTDSSVITTVYMANGADLLSDDYNAAERLVMSDNVMDVNAKDITCAKLYVFAASAQKGEGNIIFNDNIIKDVWDGSSNSVGMYCEDITENIADSNTISFIATGSTILALNQMIVTESVVKQTPEITIEVPSDVKVGDSVNVTVKTNVDGNITIVVDDLIYDDVPLDENGTVEFSIMNLSAGKHSVVAVYPGDEDFKFGIETNAFEVAAEPAPIASEFTDIVVQDDLNISFVLKDANGNVIANAPVAYLINGTANTTVTAADGSFVIPAADGVKIDVQFAGNETVLGANTTITLNVPAVPTVVKVASQFNITNRTITLNGYAVDGPAGEQGIYYATELLDENGNPIPNAYIEFAVNNKIYNRTTYENGSFKPYKLNMVRAGRYTMAFNFAGDDNYTNAFACVCVDLDKKPITIKASAKSYKAATKTKKYTATLSTIKGLDGNMYLSPKKVSLKVNGKTFTAKTNSKGQVTFKITNLTKKAKYTAVISYDGDKTYESASKKVKLTVK